MECDQLALIIIESTRTLLYGLSKNVGRGEKGKMLMTNYWGGEEAPMILLAGWRKGGLRYLGLLSHFMFFMNSLAKDPVTNSLI